MLQLVDLESHILAMKTQNILLLSVREKLLHDIIEKYKLNNVSYYKIEVDNGDIVKEIIKNVI